MANISYGVNILPKTNNAYTLGNSDYKWANIFTNKINGTDVASIIAGGGSGGEGSNIDVSDKVDKAALLDAGVTNSTYSTAFGGTFTVTTATDANNTVPYAKASVTGTIDKYKRFRVTINDTEYVMESGIWFISNKYYNYLGNLTKIYDHAAWIPGGIIDVPFLITFDRDNNSSIEVWTTTAGTYTIKIETITDTFKKLPSELIYGSAYPPILQCKNEGSTFSGYSLGVNILRDRRGTMAFGYGNELVADFALAIGTAHSISGENATAIGFNNSIHSNLDTSLGTQNIMYGSSPYSTTVGIGNTIYSNSSYSGTFGQRNTIEPYSQYANAFGYWNINDGENSTSLGYSNSAFSDCTLAMGAATTASGKCQITLGTLNVIDATTSWVASTSYEVGDKVYINNRWYKCITANSDATFTSSKWTRCRSKFLEILGNGDIDASPITRSNARATDWDGNTYIKGDVYVGCNADSSGGTKLISATTYASESVYGVVKVSGGLGTGMDANNRLAIVKATAANIKAGVEEYRPIVPLKQHEAVFYGLAKAAGDSTQSASSNSIGSYTSGALSAIQSMLAVPSNTNPVFTGTFSLNRAANSTIGTNSVSIGESCTSSGEDSFAEGRYTTASGYYSHAEGNYTTALGMASHAEGTVTIANHASQHVFGEYNVEDASEAANYSRGNFVEIVGNGTASNAQSNARALDWNGNEYLNGYLYVGCNASSGNGTRIPHDIQIDGTSIVSNGIATIPLAVAYQNAENPGCPGLVHPSADYGTKIQDNVLAISGATETDVKTGTTTRRPLTPLLSKNIVFYGLAKAAGDSTQSSSSNAIGTYTADAKSAIQSMLAVAPTASPTFTGSITLGTRKPNETIGTDTIACGWYTVASESCAAAIGSQAIATAQDAFAMGAHAEAKGWASQAFGYYTKTSSRFALVNGTYNVEDDYSNWPAYSQGVSYPLGTKVLITYAYDDGAGNISYVTNPKVCIVANSSTSYDDEEWETYKFHHSYNYAHIIGNGTDDARSNAYALDWEGNGHFGGDVYVNCNTNSTGGAKVATVAQLPSVMVGATSSVAGSGGLVPAPATTDVDKFLAGDGTYKSGGLPMVILSYGNSVWQDFIDAYNNNVIVYTRASSNSNPATGSQTRMAFMAYVNNATTPTEVEFQYYRSMSSHSATAMGDQVFVYKLTKTGGWSVTTRDASIKEIKMATGSAGSVSWSSNVVTLNSGLPAVTADDNGKILKVVNGAWAVVDP